jgi:pimeloyl-ACP methyl ester carboxylesterase
VGVIAPAPISLESTHEVVLRAHDYGGNGRLVLFCHATGFHGRYWDPIVEQLQDRYRCVAIDFRGHGDSTLPDGASLDWWAMAADLLALVDHLGLSEVSAVGHSMGGAAIVMAELERPGTIDVAWLFEPILFRGDRSTTQEQPSPMAAAARRRREVFDSREEAFERYASRPPFSGVDARALKAYVDYGFDDLPDGTIRLKCRGEVEARTFEASIAGAREHIGAVATVCTIGGSGDGDGPAVIAPDIAAELPNARFESYPDLTHFAPMEEIDRISDAIAATLC